MRSRLISTEGKRETKFWDGDQSVTPAISTATFPAADVKSFSVLLDVSPKGPNEFNPHSFVKEDKHMFRGESSRIWTSSNGLQYRRIESTGVVRGEPPTLPAADRNDSYNKALAKVYEKVRSGVDLSVSAAEAGSTFRMLKTASNLSKYVLSFHPKNFSKKILEYQLGWKPLVMDLYGATQLVMARVPQIMRFTERASAKSDRVIIKDLDAYERSTRVEKQYFRTEIGIVYTPSTHFTENFARFASLNPASVLWELVPLSFLVDYIFNIGSFLRMAESSVVLTGRAYGYTTSSSLMDVTEVIEGTGVTSADQKLIGSWTGSRQIRTKDRVLFDSLPVPKYPVLRVNLGASRILTVAALLDVFVRSPSKGVQARKKVTRIAVDKALNRFARSSKDPRWNADWRMTR